MAGVAECIVASERIRSRRQPRPTGGEAATASDGQNRQEMMEAHVRLPYSPGPGLVAPLLLVGAATAAGLR